MLSVIKIPTVSGAAAGEDAATWLTEFLGKPVRLVRYVGEDLTSRRPCSCNLRRALLLELLAPHRVVTTRKKPICGFNGARVRE